jgi:hypothetical protein
MTSNFNNFEIISFWHENMRKIRIRDYSNKGGVVSYFLKNADEVYTLPPKFRDLSIVSEVCADVFENSSEDDDKSPHLRHYSDTYHSGKFNEQKGFF